MSSAAVKDLLSLIRSTIDDMQTTIGHDAPSSRTLQRALALLWSAHDEVESLRSYATQSMGWVA